MYQTEYSMSEDGAGASPILPPVHPDLSQHKPPSLLGLNWDEEQSFSAAQ